MLITQHAMHEPLTVQITEPQAELRCMQQAGMSMSDLQSKGRECDKCRLFAGTEAPIILPNGVDFSFLSDTKRKHSKVRIAEMKSESIHCNKATQRITCQCLGSGRRLKQKSDNQ